MCFKVLARQCEDLRVKDIYGADRREAVLNELGTGKLTGNSVEKVELRLGIILYRQLIGTL